MEKQTVGISGEFTLDEFRDIFASLAFEGYNVTAQRDGKVWTILGEKNRESGIVSNVFQSKEVVFGS